MPEKGSQNSDLKEVLREIYHDDDEFRAFILGMFFGFIIAMLFASIQTIITILKVILY